MAGKCGDPTGQPIIGCEPYQMLEEGFINETQFRGVEKASGRCDLNRRAFPNLKWIENDFFWAMESDPKFNPGVVNMDSYWTPGWGCDYFGRIMSMMNDRNISNCVVLANLVMKSRFLPDLISDEVAFAEFNKSIHFQNAFNEGDWEFTGNVYHYNGTGSKSKTEMATFIFVKGGSK
jgi:hypothetical protein